MTWKEYPWPEWVPPKVRAQIEEFWAPPRRKPEDWCEAAERESGYGYGKFPLFMERARAQAHSDRTFLCGGYVYAWGNMGRLVLADGSVAVVSGAPRSPPPVLPPRASPAWQAARAARLARDHLRAADLKDQRAAAVAYAAAEENLRRELMLHRVRKAAARWDNAIRNSTKSTTTPEAT